jgi:hypothetical protein
MNYQHVKGIQWGVWRSEVVGCWSGLHNIAIEAERYGVLSELAIGVLRSFGGDTDKADDIVGGVLTLVPEIVGLPDVTQSEHYWDEGREMAVLGVM